MQIYLARNGQREGPFTLDEVKARLAAGTAGPSDLAWAEGLPNWVPLDQFPGLKGPGAPVPPPIPAVPPLPVSGPALAPAPAPPPKKSNCGVIALVVGLVVVVGIVVFSLLAAIAVPNFLRARKRSQVTKTLETLRMIDAAMDQYAIETGRAEGFRCTWDDLAGYFKPSTELHAAMKAGRVSDGFGHPIRLTPIQHPPQVPEETVRATSDVIPNPEAFWGAYYEPEKALQTPARGPRAAH